MKKLFITCIVLLFVYSHSNADVGGEIVDQVWDINDSPVLVTDNLVISGLSIEPGVIVEFAGNYKITVLGILSIVGTKACPVVLKPAADNTLGWQGIYFEDTMPGSEFEWCRFEGALNSAVHLVNSNPPFRYCTFVGNLGSKGGAIRANLGDGDLIVENCRFLRNYADESGGAIWASLATGTFVTSDCSFRENKANPDYVKRHASAGAVLVKGNSTFLRCAFYDNRANSYTIYAKNGIYTRGGAIWSQDGQCKILACRFQNNACRMTAHSQTPDRSYAYGGAIFFYSGSMVLENSLFAKNTLSAQRNRTYRGSALYVNTGDCRIVNCTLVKNTNASAIYNSTGSVNVINSIIYFNNDSDTQISGTADVSYSDIQGGFEGENVITYNPVLASGYNLLSGSPVIDQGHPDPDYKDTLPPGLGTDRNDMGFLGGPNAHFWDGLNNLEGACCLPDGLCIQETKIFCVSEGGDFQGIGTDCAFVECPLKKQPPIANAGPDQIVFESVNLDGSVSSDPDGSIISWQWSLSHRTNIEFNRSETGSNPRIDDLAPGFYDVVLTVTNNTGNTGTDSMLLGVGGRWDIDGDGSFGLSECVYILQILSGIKSEN